MFIRLIKYFQVISFPDKYCTNSPSFNLLKILIISSIPLISWGCLRTTISYQEPDRTVLELADQNPAAIFLSSSGGSQNLSLGHQYLFLIIPFGHVVLADSQQKLFNAAYEKLSLMGYKPLVPPESGSNQYFPRVDIVLKDIQLNAYDLLALRKIAARLCIEVSFQKSSLEQLNSKLICETSSSFKAFAFEKQLTFQLDQTLRQTFDHLTEVLPSLLELRRD